MNPGKERRRHARLKQSPQAITIVSGHGERIPSTLLDDSPEGLSVECAAPLAVGEMVTVAGYRPVSYSTAQARDTAKVVRCGEGRPGTYVIGLHFQGAASGSSSQQSNGAKADCPVDYYELLEVNSKASPDTIHRVYRILAQRCHPDNPDTGDESRFKEILAAYRVLSDPERRASYDVQRNLSNLARWSIFDKGAALRGPAAEKRKRQGILSALYTKRVNEPTQPSLTLHEMEDLLGCPREHLEFSLWYLKENGLAVRTDNGRFTITAKGVDEAEVSGVFGMSEDRLLPSAS